MSSRVTRSSAKHPAESPPDPAPNNSQPPNLRKRKVKQSESDINHPNTVEEQNPKKRTKRPKLAEEESPPQQPPTKRLRRGRNNNMSSLDRETSETTPTSEPPLSDSSKKKSGKSRRVSQDQSDIQPSSTSKRTRPPSSRKSSEKSKQLPDEDLVAESSTKADRKPTAEDTSEDDEGAGQPSRNYDEDEEMQDDPFESSFLARHHGRGMGAFSSTLRALSGMISGMTSRFRTILEQLRSHDPSEQNIGLTQLSEILLVSTEDNLAGHFSPEQFVKELVILMQPTEFGENPEMMLLACRCIANMMEALPASTATVVYGGAVPVLVSKLLEIQFMDVAEQALTTLEKISVEFPASIVREGGLSACLTYLDFFPTSTQRTAVTTAANCCRNIPDDSFGVVKDVMPILLNVLNSNDQRVVEQGCLCVSRIVESFKYQDDRLEELVSTDLLKAILRLLLPGATNLISQNIHTQFLRVLSITARASPSLTVDLFRLHVVDTLYQILTGVSPPSGVENVAQKLDSVIIMQALIHRPRDQIFETLNVICELLPGLSRESMGFMTELISQIAKDNILARSEASIEKRLTSLASCHGELRRFAVILFPTLTDAYSSTVNLSVRQKVLTAQLKMLSHLDTDILEEALRPVPYASFLASILSQQDHPFLVVTALQAAELLLKRMEKIYRYQFHREGVTAEIRKLAIQSVGEVKADDDKKSTGNVQSPQPEPSRNDDEDSDESDDEIEIHHPDHIEEDMDDDDGDGDDGDDIQDEDEDGSGSSDSSASPQPQVVVSHVSNVQDLIIRLSKRFVDRYDSGRDESGLRTKAESMLEDLKELVYQIAECYERNLHGEGEKLFLKLAKYFQGDALESITSYELLNSEIVTTLLDIFQLHGGSINRNAQSAFMQAFMTSSVNAGIKTTTSSSPITPFSILVHKLQDLLSRSEHFEVITVHQNSFDSNRSSAASMLAKQIKIRLTADEESGIPRPYRNIMVSIHAIATFKALDDYLRPRISLAERPRPSRHRDISGNSASTYAAAMAGLEKEWSSKYNKGNEASSSSTLANPAGSRHPGSRKSSTTKLTAGVSSTADDSLLSSPAEDTPIRRRSNRKGKSDDLPKTPSSAPTLPPEEDEDDMEATLECADEAQLSDEDPPKDSNTLLETIVGEVEEEVEDGEDEADRSAVNMEVASSGKVTARQADGTRIATPTQGSGIAKPPPVPSSKPSTSDAARSLLSSLSGRSISYAAAAQLAQPDWHLEFSISGQPISHDTTIYRAVHFNQASPEDVALRTIWSTVHSINFKRVPGPPSDASTLSVPQNISTETNMEMPQSLKKNPVSSTILKLLRVLHEMNANLEDVLAEQNLTLKISAEPLAQFVNTKLTAKLNRQLEEPLIVASNCLPSWSEDLARLYPFLFPFETRHLFLQSTSFGYSRSMTRWQNSQATSDARRDRHRDERPFLGRLQRQKVRISRAKILESAVKVMELYGASPSLLEVEYFEEVGTGLGPTLEFYSSVSKEFARKRLRLWRENDYSADDEFVFSKRGLFPAPMSDTQTEDENAQKVLFFFKVLGKFVARSMLDSRIIDISFNPTFFRVSTESGGTKPTLGDVKSIDEDLAKSLLVLKQFATAKKLIEASTNLSPLHKAQKISRIQIGGASVDDMGLDFTLPGHPWIELIPGGATISVTIDNLDDYINRVVDYTAGKGVRRQVEAFRSGFSSVFPYSALQAFTPDELVMLFGRVQEDWSIETLMDSIKADHGYNLDSKSVKNLLQTMSELTMQEKRDFLQFVTGSPKLPIGGFKSLTPLFTVVCKPSEAPYVSDDYLPSVMTCVNYLKLPDYTSLEVMKEKLSVAIREGQGSFHLS